MTITTTFDPPLPSDTPAVFDAKAFTLLGDLNDWSSEANALASDVNAKEATASAAATTATTQAGNAASSAAAAAASFDNFDDRYLGPKASNPTLDNDGAALLEGALYWNTTAKEMRAWNGTAWVQASVANAVSRGGDTMTGNLNFSGTGLRLTGDFSNATVANRLYVQTSTSAGNTSFGLLPHPANATPVTTFEACLAADPANSSVMQAQVTSTDVRFNSGARGTASFLPMTFYAGGGEALRIDTSKNVLVTGSGGLGYGVGSGGTVTQATSKSTSVTLNKPAGAITMNNAALGAGASASFLLNNSSVALNDSIAVSVNASGIATRATYIASVCDVGIGNCTLRVTNISAGSLSEAVVINFAVVKGATS